MEPSCLIQLYVHTVHETKRLQAETLYVLRAGAVDVNALARGSEGC